MGSSQSKFIREPSAFASPFSPQISSIVTASEAEKWKSFDYVIIGGGTAGCVLAARLSEDSRKSVLLLEAGDSHEGNLWARIPLAFHKLFQSPADWNFYTTPQKVFDGRNVHWPRGRILGGSSSINALLYHHSAPEDFDAWERRGASGWGYNSFKKYLDRVRKDGPNVLPKSKLAPVSIAAIEAMKRTGIPPVEDFNTDEGTMGCGQFAATIDANFERSSAATAYLTPEVMSRTNLTVAVTIYTERILFTTGSDGEPTAVGVQISSGRSAPKFAVRAKREVILSAGAVGSPQILQLSGLGPAALLSQHQIPIVRGLPHVGRNLVDHVSAGALVLRSRAGQTLDQYTQSPLYGALALLRWLLTRKGPMSTISAQAVCFVRFDDMSLPFGPPPGPVKDLSSGPHAPDLEVVFFPIVATEHGRKIPPSGNYGVSVGSILLKPASSGTIELRSNSVFDPPVIDPNYLADESDLNQLIRATRFILQLANTPPLSEALALRNLPAPPANPDFYWPGDADPNKISDEEIKKFIRASGQTTFHPVGSARMGADETNSVVDPELRVHGVYALRVVDGSVFPDQLSGHPCVPIMAAAERAAELIKTQEGGLVTRN